MRKCWSFFRCLKKGSKPDIEPFKPKLQASALTQRHLVVRVQTCASSVVTDATTASFFFYAFTRFTSHISAENYMFFITFTLELDEEEPGGRKRASCSEGAGMNDKWSDQWKSTSRDVYRNVFQLIFGCLYGSETELITNDASSSFWQFFFSILNFIIFLHHPYTGLSTLLFLFSSSLFTFWFWYSSLYLFTILHLFIYFSLFASNHHEISISFLASIPLYFRFSFQSFICVLPLIAFNLPSLFSIFSKSFLLHIFLPFSSLFHSSFILSFVFFYHFSLSLFFVLVFASPLIFFAFILPFLSCSLMLILSTSWPSSSMPPLPSCSVQQRPHQHEGPAREWQHACGSLGPTRGHLPSAHPPLPGVL